MFMCRYWHSTGLLASCKRHVEGCHLIRCHSPQSRPNKRNDPAPTSGHRPPRTRPGWSQAQAQGTGTNLGAPCPKTPRPAAVGKPKPPGPPASSAAEHGGATLYRFQSTVDRLSNLFHRVHFPAYLSTSQPSFQLFNGPPFRVISFFCFSRLFLIFPRQLSVGLGEQVL